MSRATQPDPGEHDATLLREVSTVTVLYNSAEVIDECVASIPPAAEVILVDNASSDDGAQRAVRHRADALMIRSERNVGFGGGCNVGWSAATRPYLAFINPDVRLSPDTLSILLRRLRDQGGGMVGPMMLDRHGLPRPCKRRPSALLDALGLLPSASRWAPTGWDGKLDASHSVHREGGAVSSVEGACFVISRVDLERIGGFDQDFFLYYEEESLALRVQRSGGTVTYEPAATAEHLGGTSTREVAQLATYHHHRSQAIFYRKRDGNLIGRLEVLVLLLAILVALPASLLNAVLGRSAHTTPIVHLHTARGLLAGFRVPISSTVAY